MEFIIGCLIMAFAIYGLIDFVRVFITGFFVEGMLILVDDWDGVHEYRITSCYGSRVYAQRTDGKEDKVRRVTREDIAGKESILKFLEREYL